MASEATTAELIDLAFELPESWDAPPLSRHCDFVRDGDWIESKDQGGDDYRLLQISNIGVGCFVETGNYRWITEDTFRRLKCTEILVGDVLVARMPEPTGRAWYVKALPWRAVTAVDVAIIRTRRRELDPRFLAYFFNSPECLSLVKSLTTGTTRLRIRRADIESLRIPLPPLLEQQAIAHILSTLDDKIELNRRMSETLEAMARALFKSWFVDFDPVRAKAEGRDPGLPKDLADLFPASFQDSALGEIPMGWEVRDIDSLCESISSGGTPARMNGAFWDGGAIPWFKTGELLDGPLLDSEEHITDEALAHTSCKLWPAGTILFALYAAPTVGRLGVLTKPGTSNQAAAGLIAKRRYGVPFLKRTLLWARKELQSVAVGAAQQNINQGVLKSHRVIVPSHELAAAYSRLASPLDDRQVSLARNNQALTAVRDTVLPKLISGELRVRDAEGIHERAKA